MRIELPRLHFFLLLPFGLICLSCVQEKALKQQGDMLMQSAIQFQAELDRLGHMTDSLWDATAAKLDQLIPSDFPSMDRNLLVKARNADHIQMFMSYETLSSEVHAIVQQAGHQDSLLSLKMRSLQEHLNDFEKEKINFLNTLAQQQPHLYRYYADQFKEINKPKSY